MSSERWLSQCEEALRLRKSQHLLRAVRPLENKDFLCFHSNDYLGLSSDPRVISACQEAAGKYGVGSTGSHWISGHHEQHHLLENELYEFLGTEQACLFSSGYMANFAAITTFLNEKDSIFQDKLNHASLMDAAQFSGARHIRYQHGNTEHLKQRLEKFQQGRTFIVTDGVFSMDGHIAPLKELHRIAQATGAQLMVDDAHGIGVLGTHGKGSVEAADLASVDLLVGTFGKAFGLSGAFITGKKVAIEYLKQFARTYIYTTALPIPIAAAARESLKIIQEEPQRRDHLKALIQHFREGAMALGFELNESSTPIQNIFIRCPEKVMLAADFLQAQGIKVGAIRAPTVAKNSERCRINLSAKHSIENIETLLSALSKMRDVFR